MVTFLVINTFVIGLKESSPGWSLKSAFSNSCWTSVIALYVLHILHLQAAQLQAIAFFQWYY